VRAAAPGQPGAAAFSWARKGPAEADALLDPNPPIATIDDVEELSAKERRALRGLLAWIA
jgi:hypothetical protein